MSNKMTIEYGYDRHVKSWCILVLDSNRNQIDSSYVGDKESLKFQIDCFKNKYNINEVKKIKAY